MSGKKFIVLLGEEKAPRKKKSTSKKQFRKQTGEKGKSFLTGKKGSTKTYFLHPRGKKKGVY